MNNVEIENANLDTFLKEVIKMTFDPQVKSIQILKRIGYYWMNLETVAKYPEPILQAFTSLYIVESGHGL